MLRILAIIGAVLVVAVGGVLAYAATQPDTFVISRTVRIAAAPDKVFPLIQDLKAFNRWNPFLKLDPAAKLTYSGPESGKGAAHQWSGNSNVGAGRVEITNAVAPSRVTMQLDMISPMEAHNLVEFALKPDGSATNVTWTMSGRSPFISKVMCLFFSMDKMVGGEFDKGLASLKALAET